VLTVSYNTLRIWNVATGKEVKVLNGFTDEFFYSAVYSKDGKMVITEGNLESKSWVSLASMAGVVRIWDLTTGKCVKKLGGDFTNLFTLSPDRQHILTTDFSNKTCLWELDSGKLLYTRLQLQGNDWLVYDDNFRFDGTKKAIDYLYLMCGLDIIDSPQTKNLLWVPGLVEKIMKGGIITINNQPVPKIKDLKICTNPPKSKPNE
jgi:WD40 repeat protein